MRNELGKVILIELLSKRKINIDCVIQYYDKIMCIHALSM